MTFMLKFNTKQPLQGIKVLDFSRVLAGPLASQVLADLGAEVWKIEDPDSGGDETRHWGPPFIEDFSAYFLAFNRGKKSLSLNLDQKKAYQRVLGLIKKADVVICNFLPSTAKKLKVSQKDIWKINPRAIYCSIAGYSSTDKKYSEVPGFDFAIQGVSGLMSINGDPSLPPTKVGFAVVDYVTGLNAAIAILAKLIIPKNKRKNIFLDISLFQSSLQMQSNILQSFFVSGKQSPRFGNQHPQIAPYQTIKTSDGEMVVCIGSQKQWRNFCQEIKKQNVIVDQEVFSDKFLFNKDRVENRQDLNKILEKLFAQKTCAQWQGFFEDIGVPISAVNNYEQVLVSPITKSLEPFFSLKLKKKHVLFPKPGYSPESFAKSFPPKLGEHN